MEVGIKACGLDDVFPSDSLWFGSDAGRELCNNLLFLYSFNNLNLIFPISFQRNFLVRTHWDYQCGSKRQCIYILFCMGPVSTLFFFTDPFADESGDLSL